MHLFRGDQRPLDRPPAIADERDATSLDVRKLGRCAVASVEPRGTICGAA